MRKNKKLLLGAIAAMGVMAMGVGGVSTFAWFAATAAINPVDNAQDTTVTTSALEVGNYYLVIESTGPTANVALSDKDGKTWAVQNGVYVAATGTTFSTIPFTVKMYTERNGTAGNYTYQTEASSAQLASIQSLLGNKTLYVHATQRARVGFSAVAPVVDSTFATIFPKVNNTVTCTVSIVENTGTYSLSQSQNSVYYSVAGDKTLSTTDEETEASAPTAGATAAASVVDTDTGADGVEQLGHVDFTFTEPGA